MSVFSALLAILLASCAVGGLQAQSRQASETPDAVAARLLKADSIRDWRMILALAHPAALLKYRQDQVRALQFESFPGFPGRDSCFTRQVQLHNRFMLDSVFRVPTIDSLSRMAPESVFTRQQRQFASLPFVPDSFQPRHVLVGSLIADDTTAYVIIEQRFTSPPVPDFPERLPKIMTFRLYRGAWRSMLDSDIGRGTSGFMMAGDACQ